MQYVAKCKIGIRAIDGYLKERKIKMRMIASEKVMCPVSKEMRTKLIDSLEEDFKTVSQKCQILVV